MIRHDGACVHGKPSPVFSRQVLFFVFGNLVHVSFLFQRFRLVVVV